MNNKGKNGKFSAKKIQLAVDRQSPPDGILVGMHSLSFIDEQEINAVTKALRVKTY